MQEFDCDEFLALSRELEQHHAIFYRLWNLGRPRFSEEIPTAAVSFDKIGDCIDFAINPLFWRSLDFKKKLFVICHESMHVILNHGIRMQNAEDLLAAGQALDVIVNHTLIDKFGFNREEVDPDNKYCWLNTVFPNKEVPKGKNFEYYYNLLKVIQEQSGSNSNNDESNTSSQQPSLVDDHSDLASEISEDDIRNIIEKVKEGLPTRELENVQDFLKNNFEAGKIGGNSWIVSTAKIIKKKKWETVIKKWAAQFLKENSEYQWVKRNRRYSLLSEDLLLPTENETETFQKDRIQVWFFQDTSGSCAGFIDRFFAAALSLPEDRFDIKMHCFDTRVFETSLESRKLYGFGGTSFSCIESYIQNYIKKNQLNYPKAVFLITDGYGDRVSPQVPENWYWFLSADYRYCIPLTSNIFMLKDFE